LGKRTSIQVDEKTLVRLRRQRGKMQAKANHEVTYDEVLRTLLEREERKRK